MLLKGTITLLDRAGTQITIEIEGNTPYEFHVNKIKMQKLLGQYGHTPVSIPPGGILLPWSNHDNFDWNAIGATPSKFNAFDTDGNPKEIEVLWFRGEMYTRRDMIGVKFPGGAKADDQIAYSRGAKKNADDEEKATGSTGNVGGGGYVTLIAFRKFKKMPLDFRYKEYDKDDADTQVASKSQSNQASAARPAPTPAKEQRTYNDLKVLVGPKLEAKGHESSEENINKTIIARAKKLLGKTVADVSRLNLRDNYEIYVSFGGTPDAEVSNEGAGNSSNARVSASNDSANNRPASTNPQPKQVAAKPVTPTATKPAPVSTSEAPPKAKAPAPVVNKPKPAPKPVVIPEPEEDEFDIEEPVFEDEVIENHPDQAEDDSSHGDDDDFSDMADMADDIADSEESESFENESERNEEVVEDDDAYTDDTPDDDDDEDLLL